MMMHTATSPMLTGLAALEAQLRQDLNFLELPAKPWVPGRTHGDAPVRDVVVIGGGMCGLAATAKLAVVPARLVRLCG